MEYKRLSDCATWGKDRTRDINYESYISTENMIKDKGGVTIASSLPDSKTASAYSPNDILLSNIRPYFRKIWYADKNGSCSNDVLVVRADEDIDSKFLYYVLSDNNFFNYDTVTSKGTKMPRGTQTAIMKYLVPDINVGKQRKIADILSAYDNLIENNNKRIKLLEQIAENLYKEWFVRFRFPGYEDVEFENGIPKGWKIESLSDIADIIMGQSPESENYNTNCVGLPFHQGVGSYGDFYLIDGVYSTKGNRIAEANSIIFSVRAPVGRINITLNKIILGRGVAGINSVKGYNAYLLWMLKNRFQQEDIIGNGSIFASVTKKELFGFKMFMPNEDLIQKFDSIASGIESVMRNISLINSNLKKQRDTLLPRLMSGKIEV
jgi:Restriction endonuclease S subunits